KIRSARLEVNVPPSAKLKMLITQRSKEADHLTYGFWKAIQRLARIDTTIITDVGPFPGQTRFEEVDRRIEKQHAGKGIQITMPGMLCILELEGVIDIEAERQRLSKALEIAEKERDSLAGRLANPSFVERAKPEAVEKARADHDEKASEAEKYRAALARLG
ncbi:MAG: hypothetical protein ACXWU1_09785, partial [Allosphingosinicella sp.]